jgi:hypothetical protein
MLWSISMSRSLMIFFVFAFGILSGWLLHSHLICRKGATSLKKEANDL